ncbi:DEAD/DEAH box helicase [Candidatus Woesearchaeota archaeon]|nr:MAG: DEAD/DEAH box helicase [Candidatus Woesearchaeota archaeon]
MEFKGLTLDDFQVRAIEAIEQNHSVVVSAPTGSGKTLIADYIIDRDIKKGVRVIYTAPIKALSNQKYRQFCEQFGEENVGMLTGDTVKNPRGLILVMTTEIYRNMVMVRDPVIDETSYVIFDEIHYINDIERGYVWEESVIFSPEHIRLICLSATIPNAEQFAKWIESIKKHNVRVIRHDVRPVPLEVRFFDTELGVTSLRAIKEVADIPDYRHVRQGRRERRPRVEPPSHLDLIRKVRHQVPMLFFAFSRLGCQQRAEQLAKLKLFTPDPEVVEFVQRKLREAPQEIGHLATAKMLRHCLGQGIGFHHAGLLPLLKEIVEELFGMGKIKVLYTTETFAVGINMPAKAVCFESLRKFDGRDFRLLDSKEFFQIAGRAGRRGIDKEGFVYIMLNRFDFDYKRMNEITTRDVTPIQSQFKMSVNTVLNMIKRHTPAEVDVLLRLSFDSYQKHGDRFDKVQQHEAHLMFNKYVKKLEKLGYLSGGQLTEKGEFAALIYADEIITGEVFATDFWRGLTPYQVLLMFACICFEGKRTEFRKKFPSGDVHRLRDLIKAAPVIKDDPRFKELDHMTALFHPVYHDATFFEILDNTSMLEGDIIRFFRQIADRLRQVSIATPHRELQDLLGKASHKLDVCLKDIDVLGD